MCFSRIFLVYALIRLILLLIYCGKRASVIMTIVAGFVFMLVLVRLSTPTDSLAPCPGRRGINLLIESENSAFG